jgi:hypothetical protein
MVERIGALDRVIAVQREGDQKALELQAKEYERRLADLNNENQRITSVLDQSIPREVFEAYKSSEQTAKELARRELQAWKDSVNGETSANAARVKTWTLAIGGLVTFVGLLLRFWK